VTLLTQFDARDAADATDADLRVYMGPRQTTDLELNPELYTSTLLWLLLPEKKKRNQDCKLCLQAIPGGNLARHEKTWHPEAERTSEQNDKHRGEAKLPRSVSEWLDFCNVDFPESGVPWPLNKLDQLPDLRTQRNKTHGQCVPWHIFEDERTTHLPSLERVLVGLDIESCNDAWHLSNPIRLTNDHFLDWKAQLLEQKHSKTRLLNVKVTEEVVSKFAQDHHHTMVSDKVQDFYGVEADHDIDIHNATFNITPKGTATEINHDSDPHISTACGPSNAKPGQPVKLWILWKAFENRRLSTCYSDTVAALDRLGPCGYLIQRAGESLMLPANVPHAAFSLSSHFLYGQTFHVQGRARDQTTFALELSAGIKPEESIDRVIACYKEGLQDPDPRIRSIHIDYLLCTMSIDHIAMRQINRESCFTRLIAVLRDHRVLEGACGLCQYLGIAPQSDEDCWERHPLESEQQFSAGSRRLSHTKRRRSAISDPAYTPQMSHKAPRMSVDPR
jgi:hypothetical protein